MLTCFLVDRVSLRFFSRQCEGDVAGHRDQEIRRILLRRRTRFAELRDLLADDARTAFVIVLAAERLPALETIERYGRLLRTGVQVGTLVVNKRSPADRGEFLARWHAQEQDIVGEAALDRFAAEIARAH